MESDIKQLSVGQALVVGECVEQPIVVNIRARESKHIGAVEAKGKNVEAETGEIHYGKGADDGHGQRQGRDYRGRRIAQKQKDNQHHQEHGE